MLNTQLLRMIRMSVTIGTPFNLHLKFLGSGSVKSGDFFAAFGVEVHAADRYDHARNASCTLFLYAQYGGSN
jgi:hypothetical protein